MAGHRDLVKNVWNSVHQGVERVLELPRLSFCPTLYANNKTGKEAEKRVRLDFERRLRGLPYLENKTRASHPGQRIRLENCNYSI